MGLNPPAPVNSVPALTGGGRGKGSTGALGAWGVGVAAVLLPGRRITCWQDPGHVLPFAIVIRTQERELHGH